MRGTRSALVAGIVLLLAGCGKSTTAPGGDDPEMLPAGATMPLNRTVRIDQPGAYPLPPGAALLTTRC